MYFRNESDISIDDGKLKINKPVVEFVTDSTVFKFTTDLSMEDSFLYIENNFVLQVIHFTDLHGQVLDKLFDMGATNIFIFEEENTAFCTRGTNNPLAISDYLGIDGWSVGLCPNVFHSTTGPSVSCRNTINRSLDYNYVLTHEEYNLDNTRYKLICKIDNSYKAVILENDKGDERMRIFKDDRLVSEFVWLDYLHVIMYHDNGTVSLTATVNKLRNPTYFKNSFFNNIGTVAFPESQVYHYEPQMPDGDNNRHIVENDKDVNVPDITLVGGVCQYNDDGSLKKEIVQGMKLINHETGCSTDIEDYEIVINYNYFSLKSKHCMIAEGTTACVLSNSWLFH